MDHIAFEYRARLVMSQYFGVPLRKGGVGAIPKEFDMVSEDGSIVGDAKYFSKPGSGKRSTIAEHVWLLEKTGAAVQFLVFGRDPSAALQWKDKYGDLSPKVLFYFVGPDEVVRTL